MAVTAQSSGTKTAAGSGTEDILLDVAIAGTFTLHVDLNAMADGDVVEFRAYQIVLTGGTRRVVYKTTRSDAQPLDEQGLVSVPLSNELTDAGSIRYSLTQTAGTGKAFPWKVLKYA